MFSKSWLLLIFPLMQLGQHLGPASNLRIVYSIHLTQPAVRHVALICPLYPDRLNPKDLALRHTGQSITPLAPGVPRFHGPPRLSTIADLAFPSFSNLASNSRLASSICSGVGYSALSQPPCGPKHGHAHKKPSVPWFGRDANRTPAPHDFSLSIPR